MAARGGDWKLVDNRDFHEHLTKLGIAHEFSTLPGVGHDTMALFKALGESNWESYRTVFQPKPSATKPQPTNP